MIRVLRHLRSSLSIWYYELFLFLVANVIWLVLSLLILPIGPATAGLFHLASEAAKGEPISLGLFWEGMRKRVKLSFLLAMTIMAVTFAILICIAFYLNLGSTIGQILGIAFIYVLMLWGVVLNYPFALLEQMEKPSLLKTLRNSLLLVMDNVALSVSMSLVTLLLLILSIFPLGGLPFLLGMFAFLAVFQCKCILMLIEKYEGREQTATS